MSNTVVLSVCEGWVRGLEKVVVSCNHFIVLAFPVRPLLRLFPRRYKKVEFPFKVTWMHRTYSALPLTMPGTSERYVLS